ncbi:MAG: hypothetical protein R3C12_05885 [Planctomycetaceae bacterium]
MVNWQLLLFAQRRGLIDHDPLTGLQIPKTQSDTATLLDGSASRANPVVSAEPHRSVFVLLAETGLRIGELLSG